jgi:bacterioferritin (cytochrome b1)
LSNEPMKVDEVIELINQALPLQVRSAIMYTWLAGVGTGIEFQAVGRELQQFGSLELDDARRLVEKLVALGGKPTTKAAPFDSISPTKEGLRKVIDYENEALEALRKVIPPTGQEARSEALEHLLEHILMRKQEQVDWLERVCR